MTTIRAIPEPSVYQITSDDWRDEKKRYAFEERFLDVLERTERRVWVACVVRADRGAHLGGGVPAGLVQRSGRLAAVQQPCCETAAATSPDGAHG